MLDIIITALLHLLIILYVLSSSLCRIDKRRGSWCPWASWTSACTSRQSRKFPCLCHTLKPPPIWCPHHTHTHTCNPWWVHELLVPQASPGTSHVLGLVSVFSMCLCYNEHSGEENMISFIPTISLPLPKRHHHSPSPPTIIIFSVVFTVLDSLPDLLCILDSLTAFPKPFSSSFTRILLLSGYICSTH